MNPHIRHQGTMREMCNWLQLLDNDQIADIEQKKNSARRTQAKDAVPPIRYTDRSNYVSKKAAAYNPNSYKRDAATAERIEYEKRNGLCHICKEPGHMASICPKNPKNQTSTKINDIEEVDASKN